MRNSAKIRKKCDIRTRIKGERFCIQGPSLRYSWEICPQNKRKANNRITVQTKLNDISLMRGWVP